MDCQIRWLASDRDQRPAVIKAKPLEVAFLAELAFAAENSHGQGIEMLGTQSSMGVMNLVRIDDLDHPGDLVGRKPGAQGGGHVGSVYVAARFCDDVGGQHF